MNVGVVLVTFNRLTELKKTIRLYEQQTVKPAYILVVDNHSTDGTAEFLTDWAAETGEVTHEWIALPENAGGSGGFHAGMEAALRMPADWIWLADDDAYPHENVFQVLADFCQTHSEEMRDVVALCTQNYAGEQIAVVHRRRVKRTFLGAHEIPVAAEEYAMDYFPVDIYSFVGAVVKKETLQKVGPARKEFFIYADDAEHSLRMRQHGRILCVPKAKVYHVDNSNCSREASWRDYYATRNGLLVTKQYFGKLSFQVIKLRRLLTALRSRNPERVKVFWAAITDAQNDVTGIHPVYRPGWQPKKKIPK